MGVNKASTQKNTLKVSSVFNDTPKLYVFPKDKELAVVSMVDSNKRTSICIDREEAHKIAIFLIQEFDLNIDLGSTSQLSVCSDV